MAGFDFIPAQAEPALFTFKGQGTDSGEVKGRSFGFGEGGTGGFTFKGGDVYNERNNSIHTPLAKLNKQVNRLAKGAFGIELPQSKLKLSEADSLPAAVQEAVERKFGLGKGRGVMKNFALIQEELSPYVDFASKQYGIPKTLLVAQQAIESSFRKRIIEGKKTSSADAFGISQFIPSTAKIYGVTKDNLESQVLGQARFLSDLKKQFGGDLALAVLAYHQGAGNVRKYLKGKKINNRKGRAYVKHVLGITLPKKGKEYKGSL